MKQFECTITHLDGDTSIWDITAAGMAEARQELVDLIAHHQIRPAGFNIRQTRHLTLVN